MIETGPANEERAMPGAPPKLERLWRRNLPGIGGIAVVILGCIAWAMISFGSIYQAYLYAAGFRVTIEPTTITVQDGKLGEAGGAVLLIRNLTGRPVRLLGVSTSCTCVSTDKMPVVIPPHLTKELHVMLKPGEPTAPRSEQIVVYHTDHPTAPRLVVKVTGGSLAP